MLERDDARAEGLAEGREEGRRMEVFGSVHDGYYTAEQGAKRLGLDIETFMREMSEAGY